VQCILHAANKDFHFFICETEMVVSVTANPIFVHHSCTFRTDDKVRNFGPSFFCDTKKNNETLVYNSSVHHAGHSVDAVISF